MIGRWLCALGWHKWREHAPPPWTDITWFAWADGKRTATCTRCGVRGVKYGLR